MLRRLVVAWLGLCLAPLLAACGGDGAATVAGDVVRARQPDQFDDGDRSMLLFPTGRLQIRLGDPVASLPADATQEREALEADAGTVFVPLTWHYDPSYFEDLRSYFATDDVPELDLEVGATSYRLSSPSVHSDGAESFYVLVRGSVESVTGQLTLDASFDGVEQSVDLASGKRSSGDAAALYDLRRKTDTTKHQCGGTWFDDDPATSADFECTFSGPVALPYAAGSWTATDRDAFGVSISTSFARYGVVDPNGTGGVYAATHVRNRFTVDGEKPILVVESDGADNRCPNTSTLVCSSAAKVVFDVTDDGSKDVLDVAQTYRLTIGQRYGRFPGKRRIKLRVGGPIDLR